MTAQQRRIAAALKGARTWTNWPQLNDLAKTLALELQVPEGERSKFLKLAGAIDKRHGIENEGPGE